jgi:hypothetical protein
LSFSLPFTVKPKELDHLEELMKRIMVVVLLVALFLAPGILAAQMQGGGKGQQMKTQMHANMGTMADMMAKIYEMMNKGNATSEQWQEMMNIMEQMIQMMKEMSVPHGGQMQEQHQKQLQDMNKSLNTLYENVVR